MFLRLCGPPSIPLSFTVALNAFARGLTIYRKPLVIIVYGVDYQGI